MNNLCVPRIRYSKIIHNILLSLPCNVIFSLSRRNAIRMGLISGLVDLVPFVVAMWSFVYAGYLIDHGYLSFGRMIK